MADTLTIEDIRRAQELMQKQKIPVPTGSTVVRMTEPVARLFVEEELGHVFQLDENGEQQIGGLLIQVFHG
jgi:hypothetical protein